MAQAPRKSLFGLLQDEGDYLALSNTAFEKTRFDSMNLNGGLKKPIRVTNVDFHECWVGLGHISIKGDCVLDNVTFTDIDTSQIDIDAENVILRNVTFRGRRPKLLRIKPPYVRGRTGPMHFEHKGYRVDVSEFGGEVETLGVPIEHIKIDPSKHWKMERERLDGVVWADLGVVPPNLATTSVKELMSSQSLYGVATIETPIATSDGTVEKLRQHGYAD